MTFNLKFDINDDWENNNEIIDDEIVVTDDEENEVERFINFEIED